MSWVRDNKAVLSSGANAHSCPAGSSLDSPAAWFDQDRPSGRALVRTVDELAPRPPTTAEAIPLLSLVSLLFPAMIQSVSPDGGANPPASLVLNVIPLYLSCTVHTRPVSSFSEEGAAESPVALAVPHFLP